MAAVFLKVARKTLNKNKIKFTTELGGGVGGSFRTRERAISGRFAEFWIDFNFFF